MVGREVSSLYPKQETDPGDVLLDVRGLTSRGVFSDVSFSVRSGEIVGLAGLVGAGRSEVIRAVFGIDTYDAGEVRVAGSGFGRTAQRRRSRRAWPSSRRIGDSRAW